MQGLLRFISYFILLSLLTNSFILYLKQLIVLTSKRLFSPLRRTSTRSSLSILELNPASVFSSNNPPPQHLLCIPATECFVANKNNKRNIFSAARDSTVILFPVLCEGEINLCTNKQKGFLVLSSPKIPVIT